MEEGDSLKPANTKWNFVAIDKETGEEETG
jgi:hypothetical protein